MILPLTYKQLYFNFNYIFISTMKGRQHMSIWILFLPFYFLTTQPPGGVINHGTVNHFHRASVVILVSFFKSARDVTLFNC